MKFNFDKNLYITLERYNTSKGCSVCKTQLGFYTDFGAPTYENKKRRLIPTSLHRMKLLNNVGHTQNSAPHLTTTNFANQFTALFIQDDGTVLSPKDNTSNLHNAYECSPEGTRLFSVGTELTDSNRPMKYREKNFFAYDILSHFQEHKEVRQFLGEKYWEQTKYVLRDLVDILPISVTSLHSRCETRTSIEVVRQGKDSPHGIILDNALTKAPLLFKSFAYIARLFQQNGSESIINEKDPDIVYASAIIITALVYLYRRGGVAKNYKEVFLLDMVTDYNPVKILDAIISPGKNTHFVGTRLFSEKMTAIKQILNIDSGLKGGQFRFSNNARHYSGLSIMLPVLLRNDGFSTKIRLSLTLSDHAARCSNSNCCAIRFKQVSSAYHPVMYIEESEGQTFFHSSIIERDDVRDLNLALNHAYSANRMEGFLMRDFHMIRQNLYLTYNSFVELGNATRSTRQQLLSALNEIKEQLMAVLVNYPTTNILERTHNEILHQSSILLGATDQQPKKPLLLRDFILHYRFLLATIQLAEGVLLEAKTENYVDLTFLKELKHNGSFKDGGKHLNDFIAPKKRSKHSIIEVITALRNLTNFITFLNEYEDYSYVVTLYPMTIKEDIGVVDLYTHNKSLLIGIPEAKITQNQVGHAYCNLLVNKLIDREVTNYGVLFDILNIFARGFIALQPGQKTFLIPLTPIKEKSLLSSLAKSVHQFGYSNREETCLSKHNHTSAEGLCFKEG